MSVARVKADPAPAITPPYPDIPPAKIIEIADFLPGMTKPGEVLPPDERDSFELTAKLFRRAARKTLEREPITTRIGSFHSIELPTKSPPEDIRASVRRLLNMVKTDLLEMRIPRSDATKHYAGIDVIHRRDDAGTISSFETKLRFDKEGRATDIDTVYRTLDREFMLRLLRNGNYPTSGAA